MAACRFRLPSFDVYVEAQFGGPFEPALNRNNEKETGNAIHGDSQSRQELGGGRAARPEASCRHGEVQRRAGEGWGNAGRRGTPSELEGRARSVFRIEEDRDRRTLLGDQ